MNDATTGLRRQGNSLLGEAEDGTEIVTPYVEPLAERIETTRQGGDDIHTNRKFIELMDHEDNEGVVRMLTMGLAMNDPASEDEPRGKVFKPAPKCKCAEDDGTVAA